MLRIASGIRARARSRCEVCRVLLSSSLRLRRHSSSTGVWHVEMRPHFEIEVGEGSHRLDGLLIEWNLWRVVFRFNLLASDVRTYYDP